MSSATSNLSSTHSVRTIAVLEECIEKLQFLGAIAPDVLSHRDELTAFVGGEVRMSRELLATLLRF